MQRRDRGLIQSLGLALTKRVKESRVLLVGAGGIGCEVLKNLVCCGFGSLPLGYGTQNGNSSGKETEQGVMNLRMPQIVVIDMDTIDLSNLNRQFLFRKKHIKHPKAFIAKETALQFNPCVNIDAHHASIFDCKYNVEFFETFDLVFNALDNLAARRHVNKMCLAANVTLIESGTTGFNGQVQVIRKGVTECYDCNEKPVQKSFPICTIRSTPSQPIHCIVWAKSYLFPELFGTSEEDSGDVAITEGDNSEEVAKLKEEAEALKKIKNMMGQAHFAQEVFDKVFHDDIERLRGMSEMWQSRKPPNSLQFEVLNRALDSDVVQRGKSLATQDQLIWNLHDNLAVFCYAIDALSRRAQAGETVIEFDKDDKDTLDFVAAAANLRSHVFGIPLRSEWEIKQMAGNIIPAIATSNAMTASLCVLEAFKTLRAMQLEQTGLSKPNAAHLPPVAQQAVNGKDERNLGASKMVFLNSKSTERMITSQPLSLPNPNCPVCSPVYAKLKIPATATTSLHDVVHLLQEKIGYESFSITSDAGIIYEPDLEDNLPKPIMEYVKGNKFLTVMDESDQPKVDLVLSIVDSSAEGAAQLALIPQEISLPMKPPITTDPNGVVADTAADFEPVDPSNASAKRKRAEEEEAGSAKKKVRASENEIHVVEDDGAILLD
ncbi:hypothetical protein M433DRAFT_148692 [Acidomyces richmondensis BFW]|nr:MAG: hypothetical protein FE78DRAFT_90786 [Acidomyces sp. 'richmondensis']KYG50582.1 hypothetical protein M433DRAFT_148692 [Acidomyces richmondensis BFW]